MSVHKQWWYTSWQRTWNVNKSWTASPLIVWPMTNIFLSLLARLRAAMEFWAPVPWLTNAECAADRKHPAERWRGASKMSRSPLVITRSWTSLLERRLLTSQKGEQAPITWVRFCRRRRKIIHAHTSICRFDCMLRLSCRGKCRFWTKIWPMRMCALAWTKSVAVVASQAPSW